jgi:hypothetical protein
MPLASTLHPCKALARSTRPVRDSGDDGRLGICMLALFFLVTTVLSPVLGSS